MGRSGADDSAELRSLRWQLEPPAVIRVASNCFADRVLFPAGSATFDSALPLRQIAHEWHACPCAC